MLERDIERWLGAALKKLGCMYWKFTSPNLPGVPDRIVIIPGGRIIFVELKTEYGKIAGIQKWVRQQLQDMGADARIIKGMDQAQAFAEEVRQICDTNRTHTRNMAKTES